MPLPFVEHFSKRSLAVRISWSWYTIIPPDGSVCAIVHVSTKKLICPYPPNSASRPMLWCRFFFWCHQSAEWITDDQAFLRSYNSLLTHPLSTLSRHQVVSLSQSSSVSPVAFTDGRRGEGWARSQIRRLALYESFNTVWVTPNFLFPYD
jgi:hypothetical protein